MEPASAPSSPSHRDEREKASESGERKDISHLLPGVAVHDHSVAGLQRDIFLRPGLSFENAFDVDLKRLSAAVAQLAEHNHAGFVARVGDAAGSGEGLQHVHRLIHDQDAGVYDVAEYANLG